MTKKSIVYYPETFSVTETHLELIRCPACHKVQDAAVLHTYPFYTYVHHCINCKYVIMESEWEEVKDDEQTN